MRGFSDFSTIKSISPGAALVLAAEYDRISRVSGAPSTAVNLQKWDPLVYGTLARLGFFELLGFSNDPLGLGSAIDPTVHIMPMRCGATTDLRGAEDDLLKLFEEAGGDHALRVQLLGAVVDAIENVRSHAYGLLPDYLRPIVPHLWWLSGSVDRNSRTLSLSIYDQGVTIPVTLPNQWSMKIVQEMMMNLFSMPWDPTQSALDAQALRAALELSSTSTGRSERGKGLSKIRDVVSQCKGGRLTLISRRGNFDYAFGVEKFSTSPIPLLGTFLQIEAAF